MASEGANPEGHYSRLRERFLNNGLDGFLDYEVVELLLKLADPRPDHKPTAKALLAKFNSLGGVLESPPALLKTIKGVGDRNLFGLKLIQAVARRYLKEEVINKDYIHSSSQVISYLRHHLKNRNRELFMIILLNGRNQIIDLVNLFEGTLTTSAVYPREVIKVILERDAAAVIFVHNHPSGNLTPSKDDFSITKRLKAACKNIDVHVHDHLIIGGNDYYSFAQKGKL
ncbi:MAG: DNA repair protein RadC [Candidatus Marinimicrobia bacterium]|nr:DNA repair protein RadC [Candidatus Neomarinimicrobiota bacterium]MCH8023473.1 DNA repair protein RadC [Candidatus Neomarinimicrobiota bacterium]